jgi:hypothetical protein
MVVINFWNAILKYKEPIENREISENKSLIYGKYKTFQMSRGVPHKIIGKSEKNNSRGVKSSKVMD